MYPTIESTVGNTPLVRLQRLGQKQVAARGNVVLCKLEGASPVHAQRVCDQPLLAVIACMRLATAAAAAIAPA
jgi:cysteine synthase B